MSETDQFWQYAKRRCFWPATPKPTGTSRICLILREPGRKRRCNSENPLVDHNSPAELMERIRPLFS
jgi:hypothetical protein